MIKSIILVLFILANIKCDLVRHSSDVLKFDKIHVESHNGAINGEKYPNTLEAIKSAINNTIEGIEVDVWLTSDNVPVLVHDGDDLSKQYDKKGDVRNLTYSEIKTYKTKDGGFQMPTLEEAMSITKDKIFMHLQIRDSRIQPDFKIIYTLIEKYQYMHQMAISCFYYTWPLEFMEQKKLFWEVEEYNWYNRKKLYIPFGFVYTSLEFQEVSFEHFKQDKNQINIKYEMVSELLVSNFHKKGMSVAVWFSDGNEPEDYSGLFEVGIDVIITNYPLKVQKQRDDYFSKCESSEGCTKCELSKKVIKCTECDSNKYNLLYLPRTDINVCVPKNVVDISKSFFFNENKKAYIEQKIVAIKMLYEPVEHPVFCKKNDRNIFHFEWIFDLYAYNETDLNYKKVILTKKNGYDVISQDQINKLDFSNLQVYVEGKVLPKENIICTDLFETTYWVEQTVLGLHCYFLYDGFVNSRLYVRFQLFDETGLSIVKYDNDYLYDQDSWSKNHQFYYLESSQPDPMCKKLRDPFKEKGSCFDKVPNCQDCKDSKTCIKCREGFSFLDNNHEKCETSDQFKNNKKYYTPDNGLNYYLCSSKVKDCSECTYNPLKYNKVHCP